MLLGFLCIAQELPPIQNYAPSDYHGENQNWAISQSNDKLIYIANNKGLLEFNGAKWTRYPSPNETVMRSVKVIGDRIYTGCYMEFGYWEKDIFGSLQYTSLSKKLKIKFLPDEEFWSILDMDDWVVFQSPNRIYVYNVREDSVYSVDAETSLPNMFNVNQSIYFQRTNKGIFRIENGRSVLVYDDASLLNDEVVGIFQDNREILVLTRHNGFFRSRGASLEKWDTTSDGLLSEVSVYSSLQLQDGSLTLGTISHGLVHLDKDGNLLNRIDQTNGLRNNTVLSLFEDVDGNIWLGLDNGISYVNLKSPIKVYHDPNGVVGSVYTSAVIDNTLYLGTNQGLFYNDFGNETGFSLIPGTQGQVWSLNNIDGTLFCGHHTGTFTIEGKQATKIASAQGTWKIVEHPENPDLLLQGNYDGLYVLEGSNGKWQLRNRIEGFEHSSRYLEVFNGTIFVNHEYKGVFTVSVDPGLRKATEVTIDTLLKGSNSGLVKYKGDLLYAYKKGILKYDQSKDTFIKDSILSSAFSEPEYDSGKLMVDRKNQYLWVFTTPNITYVSEGRLGGSPRLNTIPLTEDMRNCIAGYESITPLPRDGLYAFGNSSGYVTVDLNKLSEPSFLVQIGAIRKAEKSKDDSNDGTLNKNLEGDLKTTDNNLEMDFYAAEFNKYLKPEYQYQLKGIYEDWSDWSYASSVRFENLPPGDYVFNVKSKIGSTISSNTASYSFSIAKPWYFSNLMFALYIISAILGSLAIHNLYKRYYHNRQQKLIEENKREMELTKAQNEKEIIRIKNEQLKEDYKSKSNELAASTMSIIKKNELLSKVKEQLDTTIANRESVRPIIHMIDKSLNQNDDWELFKEAFNNADRKFLKKLKKAHPNLSPNDIKLCAYLRLNLASKEIAPLLNISARSVEIKRYRLRKKLNLSHDDNLVNYILKL